MSLLQIGEGWGRWTETWGQKEQSQRGWGYCIFITISDVLIALCNTYEKKETRKFTLLIYLKESCGWLVVGIFFKGVF